MLRKVDFGTEGATKLMLRAKGEGTVEVRIGRRGAKAEATFIVSSDEMSDYTIDVDASRFTGTKSIYIVVTSGSGVYMDAWQALAQSDGIQQVENDTTVKSSNGYYNIAGQRIDPSAHYRGIIIHNGNKYIAR